MNAPLAAAASKLIDPGVLGLALAAALVFLMLALAALAGVRLWRLGLVATARTFVQLFAIGLVLEWVFARATWLAIMAVFAVMTLVAGATGSARVERRLRGTAPLLTLALALSLALTLTYVGGLILRIDTPAPRYLIPLGGMILGNAMTAGALAAQRLHDDMRAQRDRIETALCLGASPWQATHAITRNALIAALTPIINAMMIVGVVKLPGVMTGALLGGFEPWIAVKYQIVVMCMLAFSDGLTALGVLSVLRKRAFTRAWQPRL